MCIKVRRGYINSVTLYFDFNKIFKNQKPPLFFLEAVLYNNQIVTLTINYE